MDDPRDATDAERADLYRIPMVPVSAEILLRGRASAAVTLHLSTLSSTHPGGETVDEFLNSERRFIPAHARDDGHFLLLNREAILWVRVRLDAPTEFGREEHVAAPMDLVRVELVDGSTLEGALRDVSAAPDARLSDVFNSSTQFIPLEAEERIIYVNKSRVTTVRL